MKTFLQHLKEADAFGSALVPTRPVGNTQLTVPVQPGTGQPTSTSSSGLTWDQYTDMVNSGKIIPEQPVKLSKIKDEDEQSGESAFMQHQKRMADAAYKRVQMRRKLRELRGKPSTPEDLAQDALDMQIQ